MSASVAIKDWLIDKIESVSSVQKVYGSEELNPAGWPAVMVTSTDMEGEFSSTSENSRVWAYRVRIMFLVGKDVEVPKTKTRMQYAEDVVATVIDGIIDAVDTDFSLNGVSIANNYTAKFANAADVAWGYIDFEAGKARTAEITIRVYTEKTVV